MPARKPKCQITGSLLEPGHNCWRIEETGRAALIVDAADYFRIARKAMLHARSQILLIGWDFDTRIELVEKDEADGAPVHLGPFLSWLVRHRPGLKIHILAWDGQAYNFLGRGTTLLRLAQWRWGKKNIDFRFDAAHPLQGCHHHKIMVIDDVFACCGGIDMTGSRWDTREHLDENPGRRRPTTRRHYSPWHDAAMAVDAEAARALGDLGRRRWNLACKEQIAPPPGADHDPWPVALEPQFRDVSIAIARSRAENGETRELREIEALFVDMIRAARRWIYLESQYFASRKVAEAIAARLAEADGPEFVIVNPDSADGWLEEAVMGAARAALMKAVQAEDRHGRFRIYTPVAAGGTPIYVHAKIMIVDDRMLRVGSANLNNRSMGLDSECDLMIDAELCDDQATRDEITRRRNDLIAEHLGAEPEEVARLLEESGSLIKTIERLRGQGRTLVPFEPPEYGAVAETVAKSEAADPDSVDAPFEPTARHRLLRNFRSRFHLRRAAARG